MTAHAAQVAALAAVVRAAFDELDRHGRRPTAHARAALELVERWLDGDAAAAAGLPAAAKAAHEDDVPLAQRVKDRALGWANTAAGNLAWTANQGRGWKDGQRSTMDAAEYALSSAGLAGGHDRAALEALHKKALAAAARRPSVKAAKPAKVARPVRVKDELDAHVGAAAGARLRKVKAVRDASARGTEATLRALLAERGYPAHAAVFAFDARYGGLVAADGPGEEGDDWLYGAYACLKSGAHVNPRGGRPRRGKTALVPVAYSPNDLIYYLDGGGVAWAEDTIEGDLARFADDGDALVARILLEQLAQLRSS